LLNSMGMKRVLSLSLLILLAPTLGCGAVPRRAVGSAVAGLGAVATTSGMLLMMDPCTHDEHRRGLCRDPSKPPPLEREGTHMAAIGLGTLLLGGIIYLTTTPLPHPKRGQWHFHHPPRK
jgi:hypothetical protein